MKPFSCGFNDDNDCWSSKLDKKLLKNSSANLPKHLTPIGVTQKLTILPGRKRD
jgi:hypothetical protein